MVRLHVKKGDESQFLYDTHINANINDVVRDIVMIYNGRLKISRICYGEYRFFNIRKIVLTLLDYNNNLSSYQA